MIYDGHAYCFPPPARNGGFADPAEFWRHLQLFMAHARQQPCWRRSDRSGADAAGLADPDRPWRFDGLRDAAFRTGDHGLVEWTVDGEDYVKQALPPWTVDFAFPADSLVAEMDYAGVDRALLHRTPYMGLSDGWIADCCRRHPGRIQGLVQVPEWWFPARTDEAVGKLERGIRDHGLSGLQFAPFHRPLYDLSPEWTGARVRPPVGGRGRAGYPRVLHHRRRRHARRVPRRAARPAGLDGPLPRRRRGHDPRLPLAAVRRRGSAQRARRGLRGGAHRPPALPHPDPLRRLPAVSLGLPHAADAARPGDDGGTHRRRPHHLGHGHPHRPPPLDLPPEPRLREALLPLPRRGRRWRRSSAATWSGFWGRSPPASRQPEPGPFSWSRRKAGIDHRPAARHRPPAGHEVAAAPDGLDLSPSTPPRSSDGGSRTGHPGGRRR